MDNPILKITAEEYAEIVRIDKFQRIGVVGTNKCVTVSDIINSVPDVSLWEKHQDHNSVPSESGVYALLIRFESDDEPVIAYIGLSKVLCNRLKGHPVISMLKKQGCIIEIAVLPTKDYIRLEWMLIMHHKPLLNIRDNH